MKKTLTVFIFIFTIIMVHKHHDSELFQTILKSLFNPGPDFAMPQFWQDYRMYIIAVLLLLLIIYYRSVWSSVRKITKIYKESHIYSHKPQLSILQASFLYSQDQTKCFMVWLIDLCQRGILTLHFNKKNYYQWSAEKSTSEESLDSFYQKLVLTLFKENKTLSISPVVSNPNPDIEKVASKLYKHIKSENSFLFRSRKSSLIAWVFFIILILEIPTYNALYPNRTGMIVHGLFSVIFLALPFFVFAWQLPGLFSGSIKSRIMLGGSVFFALIPQFFIFSRPDRYYFETAFFPGLAIAIAVLIYKFPLFLKDNSLLSQIIGYKKYLNQKETYDSEKDLIWALGLDVHTDIVNGSFSYDEIRIPSWLKSSEVDTQLLLKNLHQTLYQSISKAIYGEMKSGDSLHGSRDLGR